MAIFPPNTAINRILAALGLENVRSLKINAAVNDVVTVVTEQYATGTQLDDLAAALETKEWVLVPKDAGRWIAVSKRKPDADKVVFTDGKNITIATRYESGAYDAWDVWEKMPTHWMPLPEPPEVK
jgi:hypothetical protein